MSRRSDRNRKNRILAQIAGMHPAPRALPSDERRHVERRVFDRRVAERRDDAHAIAA